VHPWVLYNRINNRPRKQIRGQRKNRQPRSKAVSRVTGALPVISRPSPNIHTFTRITSYNQAIGDDISVNTNTGWGGASLGDMEVSYSLQQTLIYLGGVLYQTLPNPGYNELTTLFLWYKIIEVQIEFLFTTTVSIQTNAIQLPTLYTVTDAIDVGSTALGTILQNRNCSIAQLGNSMGKASTYRFKPRCQLLAYSGASSSYVQDNVDHWISTTYPGAPHYGSKHIITTHPLGSNSLIGYCSINVIYKIQCKDAQ
jgi:hypothetical protein